MRSYFYSFLIHLLILAVTLGIRFPLTKTEPVSLRVLVGRPPSGMPSLPKPAGRGTRIEAVPIPIQKRVLIRSSEGTGPTLDLPSYEIGWGEKQFLTSFGDIDIPGGEGGGRPWYIEGTASGRRVIKEVIPQYPPGYQKEAKIRLSFEVTPEGLVQRIVVVQKGDPILERIAVEAFAQWRFEPIPDSVIQDGEITFIFKLK
ncbi:hypothetical protein DRP53_04675 [candidate division WOR-3 bacterium]|uniref:TonB C-terminal domain-containing protein n=1 Tax=candidate division WOR-3 bacterium TaxID=2052148 RepID=A0A660SI93_UNCW3|nr:MAG: hypothetical protein DRP53_04675 [candidate division WOR-3 bacterium]